MGRSVLTLVATVLVSLGLWPAAARGQSVLAAGSDPSVDGTDVAFVTPGFGVAVLLRGGVGWTRFSAHGIAVGGRYVATTDGKFVRVAERDTGREVLALEDTLAAHPAVSDRWLVYRRSGPSTTLVAVPIAGGPARIVAGAGLPASLGRPSLDGSRLVFDVFGRREKRIDEIDLTTGRRSTLRSGRHTFAHPSVRGGRLLWVEYGRRHHSLRLGDLSARGGRVLLRIPTRSQPPPPGRAAVERTLFTTALGDDAAFVTQVRSREGYGTSSRQSILRVPLR
ncbi:MAG: hypothetical protein AVDCRST_MAG85-176 [uncultured Solirubrobacteraceae bacterium]|uniref:TolB protein, periplasmic protein involved in the tonb-independent uptake of group A colicins n=1 Tax=uncultured Solirubrobacteraceae bacterium TaxID=1162706 RepID=A0A6J4RIF6_9ACTN|nr:MAG: hypothetical protein AVDCRST_MAG85-176 [uncultured Solirubrobacteraceae bacterium]